MASAVHCQLNPQVRPFVPTVMAPKLAYRRGKREEGDESVSKNQIRPGNGRWVGRRRVGWLNPRREAKCKARTGTGKGGQEIKSQRGVNVWRANGGGETEQSGTSCDKVR